MISKKCIDEVAAIAIADMDFEERECVVLGKGDKERIVYFDAKTKLHLEKYLLSRNDENPALFVTIRNPHRRLRKEFLSVSVSKKYKRIIKVDDRAFVWYIAEDDKSDHLILNIISNDKKIICSVPMDTPAAYLISKGNELQGKKTSGTWERYRLPFVIPKMITPGFVSEVVQWIMNGDETEQISWNQEKYPV